MSAPEDTGPGGPRRFRPSLWMTVASVVSLAILITLGTWQWQRLAWKTELIDRIESRLDAPPAPLPTDIEDPLAWDYRPVSVTGTFLHDRELHLGPRTWQDSSGVNQTGVHVLTPLVRADGQGTVLVDRGFVPMDRRDPASRPEGQVAGTVTVEGIARAPGDPNWMQPDNRPDENFWFWLDMDAMAEAAGVDDLSPVVVQAGPAPNPGGLPLGGRTVVAIPNNHLSYVVTWYGLALTLIGVWFVASFRRDPIR